MIVSIVAVVLACLGLLFAEATGELCIEQPGAKRKHMIGRIAAGVLVVLALLLVRFA